MVENLAQSWYNGEGLSPVSTQYARLCWLPNGVILWGVDLEWEKEKEGELGLVYKMKRKLNKKEV